MPALNMRGEIKKMTAMAREVKKQLADARQPLHPFEIGKNYLVRTVTMINVGKCKGVKGDFLILSDASWIGDTGRFHECLRRPGVFNEVEPFKFDVFISMRNIIDATLWPFMLPTEPK